MTFGTSVQSNYERLAGDASVWATYGSKAASVRRSGVSQALEPGEKHDCSVLLGRRAESGRVTLVGGVGLGVASGSSGVRPLPTETVLAVGGQANLAFSWVGIGVSGFGTFGNKLQYGGVGLTLALGRIR